MSSIALLKEECVFVCVCVCVCVFVCVCMDDFAKKFLTLFGQLQLILKSGYLS